MNWQRALSAVWLTAGYLRRWSAAMTTGTVYILCPFRNARQTVLDRVARIVADRLCVIQDDWQEHLEDHQQAPEYVGARNRARVREVNAILAALHREFPRFDVQAGIDPLEMQQVVHSVIASRPNLQPITKARAVTGA